MPPRPRIFTYVSPWSRVNNAATSIQRRSRGRSLRRRVRPVLVRRRAAARTIGRFARRNLISVRGRPVNRLRYNRIRSLVEETRRDARVSALSAMRARRR